jgi:hypothetical protein
METVMPAAHAKTARYINQMSKRGAHPRLIIREALNVMPEEYN